MVDVTQHFDKLIHEKRETEAKRATRRATAGIADVNLLGFVPSYDESNEVVVRSAQIPHLEERYDSILGIEKSISEIKQMVSRVPDMVAMDDLTIQRIDENAQSVLSNLEAGQQQLEKYYQKVKNNKWLVLKVFAVLLLFSLIFILVA